MTGVIAWVERGRVVEGRVALEVPAGRRMGLADLRRLRLAGVRVKGLPSPAAWRDGGYVAVTGDGRARLVSAGKVVRRG